MSQTSRSRTVLACALLLAPLAAGLTACGGPSSHPLASKPYDAAFQVALGGADGRSRLDPDKPLDVTAKSGARITDVTATDSAGRRVRGELSEDGRHWRSTTPLAAGTHYRVRVSTEKGDGSPGRSTLGFDTASASDKRLRVTFGPATGTYGVGQPLTAQLSTPVRGAAARAVVERGLKVRSRPAVTGSWYWVDSRTLHYRPRAYWPAHATIDARSTLRGMKVSDGLYGAASRSLRLHTGDRVEAITDAAAHRMTVLRDGRVIRTIPVTTGKPGFSTRNGVKVVLAKEPSVRMRGSTIGISEGSSDSYDLLVHWATRVTWSGEYVHAAPWSVGSQGAANVSHGCTGMSTENARWFFDTAHIGDIVKVVGSQGETMTPFDNGYGDWNLSWRQWREGSALTAASRGESGPADSTARLRPRT